MRDFSSNVNNMACIRIVPCNIHIMFICTCMLHLYIQLLISLFWKLFFNLKKLGFSRDSPPAPLWEGSELHMSLKIIIQGGMQYRGQMHCQWNKLPAGYLALMLQNNTFSYSYALLKLPFHLNSTILYLIIKCVLSIHFILSDIVPSQNKYTWCSDQ